MQPITVNAFLGANLALDPLLLEPGVGVDSQNLRPGRSDFRPWGVPVTVASVPAGTQRQTIYRMGQDVASDANYWLQWTTVVDAVRGFDSNDPTERTYFTGSGTPKWTNNVIGLTGGAPYPQGTRELAVPAPTGALTVGVNTAGSAPDATISFVYTFVNDLGWESAPSPVSNDSIGPSDTTYDLSGFDSAPSGSYGLTTIRLYKIQTGTSGVANYFYMREWPIGSTPSNPIDDARGVGADILATNGWLPPPSDSYGMTKLWNGMLSVITGKSVRPSEPYKPYAYPLAYEIATAETPVATAVWGQRLVILTAGDVYVAVGSSPDSLDSQPQQINQPCTSARSVVEFNVDAKSGVPIAGVAWASPNGLCWLGDNGFRNLTEGLMDRAQWQALVPSTIVASRYLGYYVASYNDGSGLKGFVIDPAHPKGVYFLSAGFNAVHRDPLTDTLFTLVGTNIQKWDAGSALTGTFRSKVFRQPSPINIGAIEVIAKTYPVTVNVYADGTLWHTQSVTSDTPIRPPGGNDADEWQFEITSAGRVIAVRAASSVGELRIV